MPQLLHKRRLRSDALSQPQVLRALSQSQVLRLREVILSQSQERRLRADMLSHPQVLDDSKLNIFAQAHFLRLYIIWYLRSHTRANQERKTKCRGTVLPRANKDIHISDSLHTPWRVIWADRRRDSNRAFPFRRSRAHGRICNHLHAHG